MRVGTIAVLGMLLAGCHPIVADGPFEGTIVDAESGKPIAGAAIAAFWYRRTPAFAHDMVTAYTAQEAITDKEGRFRLEGLRGINWIPFTRIQEARFIVFAPGYAACDRTGKNAEGGCGLPNVRLTPVMSLGEDEQRFGSSSSPPSGFEALVPQLTRTIRLSNTNNVGRTTLDREVTPHDRP